MPALRSLGKKRKPMLLHGLFVARQSILAGIENPHTSLIDRR
ncbi:hypothetical protein BFV94_4152 [Alteromonas macleodii]|uniref:Uncharacterized protein n=1 Tax=Alteromonas macleodii TaxID=28108 RepID=A0AB36FSM2_ALTMA|nr:hypothetical protein BFV95_4161 [Alteromonas macleodii]OES26675.1 hypothetical protein BFV94_4152 [Alteromonas macleodii]OES27111.1 hypothetical protein BFV93_4150 [Alteromonas macleodii]OES39413.1 hypothetical protein BFV96_4141 [Alteromonas macleodii]